MKANCKACVVLLVLLHMLLVTNGGDRENKQ
jgi:hypothetical protein